MNISKLKYIFSSEISRLSISVFIKTFAVSLIGIFIPIFFLSKNYSLSQITLYYLMFSAVLVPVMIFSSKLTKIGLKKNLAIGIIVDLFFLYSLYNVGAFNIYLIGAINAVSVGIYYFSFNILLAKIMNYGIEGKQLSNLRTLEIIAGVLAPLIGAVIITAISFETLLLISGILILLSISPLLIGKDFFIEYKPLNFLRSLKAESSVKALIYTTAGAMEMTSNFLWPVYIYLTLESVLSLGIIITISAFFMAAFSYFMGFLVDKNARFILKIAVFVHSPLWLIRTYLLHPSYIFIVNFLSQITAHMIEMTTNKHIYGSAKNNEHISEYFMHREIYLAVGRIIILSFTFIIFYLNLGLEIIFFTAALINLIYLVALKEIK